MMSPRWDLCLWSVTCLALGLAGGRWATQPSKYISSQTSLTPPLRDDSPWFAQEIDDTSWDHTSELGKSDAAVAAIPDVRPVPWRNTIRINHEAGHHEVRAPLPLADSAPKAGEPQPLSVEEAVPIHQANEAKDALIRGVIEAEVPHATAQQKEVWLESLRDVSDQDVAGILRMWKMLGGLQPLPPTAIAPAPQPRPPAPVATAPAPLPPDPVAKTPGAETTSQQVAAIFRRNLRSVGVPGYVPHVPQILEVRQVDGTITRHVQAVPEFLKRSHLQKTGFSLDLAIQGRGFFEVRDAEGNRFYTRWGRFHVNDQGLLAMKLGAQTLLLYPELRVYPPLLEMNVATSGEVQTQVAASPVQQAAGNNKPIEQLLGTMQLAWPLTPTVLEYDSNGLFRISKANQAQIVWASPGSSGLGEIVSGSIETYEIDAAGETATMKAWLERLQH